MAFEVIFRHEATGDLAEAMLLYESKSAGLGKRFFTSFEETLHKISNNPQHYGFVVAKMVRRCVLKKFPHAVHFLQKDNHIHILGIYHIKRSNARKRKRLGQ